MATSTKLKDPTTCRVFYSSPFNGMEGEREELTRRYWPQLASACSSVGVRFCPIDMRWGITTDQSTNFQTINICLREIDRSDVFVGFFGQRYGWHGLNDATLQMTFDAAVPAYPWLQKVRDRSVTELEFLHGCLNHPGQMPAVICFRDKEYDSKMRAKGEAEGNIREVYKYSPESEQAVSYMNDLIRRVVESERDNVSVHLNYTDPAEGARQMFEHTWKFIQDVVVKRPEKKQTVRQIEQAQHAAFLASHCQLYREGNKYFSLLNDHISQRNERKPLLVVGNSGCGKSALLCNWLHILKQQNANGIYIYHFVECASNSKDPRNILQRMVANLNYELAKRANKDQNEEDDDSFASSLSELDLLNRWQKGLQKIRENGCDVVIVIDELQKVEYKEKIVRPLFWLPKTLPTGIHLIASTTSTDTQTIEELVKSREYNMLTVEPLSHDDKMEFCRDLLRQRGKSLSEDQLQRIVAPAETSNPLFLKIVLEELCVFGKFRELDSKIDSLINCKSTTELFETFLERLESDYNPTDFNENLAEKVMCALYVSRHGLQENELTGMFSIPSHIWTPFYYAIELYLSKMGGGFLRISQSALRCAVFNRYIVNKENELVVMHELIRYWQNTHEIHTKNGTSVPVHLFTELPWLCFKADNKKQLLVMITSVSFFLKLYSLQKYELLEYIDCFNYSTSELIALFSKTIDVYMTEKYFEQVNEGLQECPDVRQDIYSVLDSFAMFFNTARKPNVEEFFLLRMQRILESYRSLELASMYQHTLDSVRYRIACLYVDVKRYKEGLPIHLALVNRYEHISVKSDGQCQLLGRSYHGAGTAYQGLNDFEKAEDCFNKSMNIHKSLSHLNESALNISNSLSCIAHLELQKNNFELAKEKFEYVVKIEGDLYPDTMPPETAYTMTNLGICYRRLGLFEKAEEVYMKALKIKVNAVGHNHFDVAYAYFNLSNLARDRKLYDDALRYLNACLDIFKRIDFDDSIDAISAKENVALIYLEQNKFDEGLPFFWEVFNYLSEHDQLELGLLIVFNNYLIHLLRTKDHEGVRKVSRAMIHCEKMRNFLPFLFLHYVNSLHPAEDQVVDIDEGIDRALELYPQEKDLVFQKIQIDLMPTRHIQEINNVLDNYFNQLEYIDERMVIQIADVLEQDNWLEGCAMLYEYWLAKNRNCESFLRNLAVTYAQMKDMEKALQCFKDAVELNPSDPLLKEKVAYCSLFTGDTALCEDTIKELETNWPENEELMKKVRLYKSEIQNIENAVTQVVTPNKP